MPCRALPEHPNFRGVEFWCVVVAEMGIRLLSFQIQSLTPVSRQHAPLKAWHRALARLTEAARDTNAKMRAEKLVLVLQQALF